MKTETTTTTTKPSGGTRPALLAKPKATRYEPILSSPRNARFSFDVAEELRRMSAALELAGICQCASCGIPVKNGGSPGSLFCFPHETFGVCQECWLNDENLGDKFDWSALSDHDIFRAWTCDLFRLHDCLAGSANLDVAPIGWQLSMSFACAIGEERIKAVLVKYSHPNGKELFYLDPSPFYFCPRQRGLVPYSLSRDDFPATSRAWEDYWRAYFLPAITEQRVARLSA